MLLPRGQSRRKIRYDDVKDALALSKECGLTMRGKIYGLLLLCFICNTFMIAARGTPVAPTTIFDSFLPVTNNEAGLLRVQRARQLSFHPPKYDYTAPTLRTNDNLPDPQLAPPNVSSHILVLVMSARHNTKARQAIRESWAKGHANVLFLVGGALPIKDQVGPEYEAMISQQLLEEQNTHHDLLDSIHPDTYRGLPYKLDYSMKWLYQHNHVTNQFHWFLKVDDDVVVRLNRLEELVLRKFDYRHPMVIGNIVEVTEKSSGGKWAEDPHYKPLYYPPWPRGSAGYVLSQPVVEYIGRTPDLHYYQGEDAGLGIWLEEGHEELARNGSDLAWIHTPDFRYKGGCREAHVVTGHKMDPQTVKDCFAQHGDSISDHKSRIYRQDKTTKLHIQVPL